MRRPIRLFSPVLLILALAACGSSPFDVEHRTTPIHVWITAADLATNGGGAVALRVVVAGQTVANGPVQFPAGVPTIEMPTVYARSGPTSIVATRLGAPGAAAQQVQINGESWVQVIVCGGQVRAVATNAQPNPWAR